MSKQNKTVMVMTFFVAGCRVPGAVQHSPRAAKLAWLQELLMEGSCWCLRGGHPPTPGQSNQQLVWPVQHVCFCLDGCSPSRHAASKHEPASPAGGSLHTGVEQQVEATNDSPQHRDYRSSLRVLQQKFQMAPQHARSHATVVPFCGHAGARACRRLHACASEG
jgi:hypothetical protein